LLTLSTSRRTSCASVPGSTTRSAIFGSSPPQRCLRDIRTLTQHFFLAPPTYEMTGKVLLGVEPDGFML
jgi:hypothetical protein